jgi:hypothetical protein
MEIMAAILFFQPLHQQAVDLERRVKIALLAMEVMVVLAVAAPEQVLAV